MKNKIQKNNEKIHDHSTRSRLIKSTWAVRFLVLLVLLTTILASFAVPASAADPFRGSVIARTSSDYTYYGILLNCFSIIGGQGYINFNEGYSSNSVVVGSAFDWSVSVFSTHLTINVGSSNATMQVRRTTGIGNTGMNFDVLHFPFEYCTVDTFVNNILCPANTKFSDFFIEQNFSDTTQVNVMIGDRTYDINGASLYFVNTDYLTISEEGGIQSIFDLIGTWLSNTFNTLGGVFFDNGSLTVLGGLAIGSLGVSVILLLIKVISNFIRFRG